MREIDALLGALKISICTSNYPFILSKFVKFPSAKQIFFTFQIKNHF